MLHSLVRGAPHAAGGRDEAGHVVGHGAPAPALVLGIQGQVHAQVELGTAALDLGDLPEGGTGHHDAAAGGCPGERPQGALVGRLRHADVVDVHDQHFVGRGEAQVLDREHRRIMPESWARRGKSR